MPHEWGLLIVVYLFLGGLSAGALVVSAAATVVDADRLRHIARTGAWIAPWPVLAGTAFLVLDLGQPFYFWKLLVSFAPASPMWLGTWLLALFLVVSLPYGVAMLPCHLRMGLLDGAQRPLAIAALPLGVGVGVYTGVLLGVLVARPLWNTPLLPQLFLVSALSTGSALVLFLLPRAATRAERRLLTAGDVVLIGLELALLVAMIVAGATSRAAAGAAVGLLVSGSYGVVFWIGVVLLGLLVPFALEAAELASVRMLGARAWLRRAAARAPLLVIAGGFLLRWVLVYAGQSSTL